MYNILKFLKGRKIIKNLTGGNRWTLNLDTFNQERDSALAATYGDEWNKMDNYLKTLKRNNYFNLLLNWTPSSDNDTFLYSDSSVNNTTTPLTSEERFNNTVNNQSDQQIIRKFGDGISESLTKKAEDLSNTMNNNFTEENNAAYKRANIGSTYSRRFGNLDKKAGRYTNAKTGKAFTAQEVWDLLQQLGLDVDGDLGSATYNALVKNGYIKPKNDDVIFDSGVLPEIVVTGKSSSHLPGHFWYNGVEYKPGNDGWSYADNGYKIKSDLSGIAKSLMNNISYTAPKIGSFYSDGSNVKYTSAFFNPPSLTKGNWKTTSDGYKRLINGNTIWVHKGGHYWRSKDNGKTWESTHTKYKK